MKIVIQRVRRSSVEVKGVITGSIKQGLLLLVGITHADTRKEADYLAEKCVNLRIFEDENGKMNLSAQDIQGEILAVSQFTLYGDTARGRRPGFEMAAQPEMASALFSYFVDKLRLSGLKIQTGIFGEDMKVELLNDGPATFILEKNAE